MGCSENGLSEGDLLEGKLAYGQPPLPPPPLPTYRGEEGKKALLSLYSRTAEDPSLGPSFLRKSPFSSGRRLEAKRTTRHNTSFALDFKFIKSRAPAVQQVSSVAGGGGGGACHQECPADVIEEEEEGKGEELL